MRILLVDDSGAGKGPADEFVAAAGGAAVVRWVGSLHDACRQLDAEPFDIVLLGLGLPDAPGLAALAGLRRVAPALPIIVLADRDEDALARETLRSGAQDYLLKDRISAATLGQSIEFSIQRQRVDASLAQDDGERQRIQRLRVIGQLAPGIAHEVNSPMQFIGDSLYFLGQSVADLQPILSAVRQFAASPEADRVPRALVAELARLAEDVDLEYLMAELPAAIDRARNGVRRVTKTVRAMNEFFRPGIDEPTRVQLSSAIESTVTVSRNEWKYVAELETAIASDLPTIRSYLECLNQVILILVVNAAQAIAAKLGEDSAEKGRITVAACSVGEQVEIRVADTGTGIAAPIRGRIFAPCRSAEDGGRGLAVAYDLVTRKLGGTIGFTTDLGEGSTFVIRLPLELVELTPVESGVAVSTTSPIPGGKTL